MMGMPKVAPSRVNKKQIMAHLSPDLVEAAHRRCAKEDITIQELIGHAVNRAVAEYGRKPFLNAKRERLVRRVKSVAKVQELDRGVRNGKRRIGAWFEKEDVEKVIDLSIEFGIKVEGLVDMGLRLLLNMEAKPDKAETSVDDWDWNTAQTAPEGAKIPKKAKAKKAA